MTCFYEPIKGPGQERRDELGNFASYRTQPHRGSDWGFRNGSEGKDIRAIHTGKVTAVENNTALGWTVIIKSVCDQPECKKDFIEYNHMLKKPLVKVGDEVANRTVIGLIGATGTSLSKSGAFHLHASCAPKPVPHNADRKVLKDLFKLIDASKQARQALKTDEAVND